MHSTIIALAVALIATPLSIMVKADMPALANRIILADAAGPAKSSVNGRPLVDAPLSTLGPAGIAPVDRVAGPGTHASDAGPINGTPFSDTPTGTFSEGGRAISQSDRTLAPVDSTGSTPNLGR